MGLNETLDAANDLFKNVRMTREAAMDANVIANLSVMATKQAQKLTTQFTDFDPVTFKEKAKTLMGARVEDSIRLDWGNIGELALSRTRHAVPVSFMFGPLSMDTQKKKRVLTQRVKNRFADDDAVKPTTDKEEITADRQKEGSEKTKELMACLKECMERRAEEQGLEYVEDASVGYYEFVTNPQDFGQTIENIFHLSFLVRDNHVRITIDEKTDLPQIWLADGDEDRGTAVERKQVVMQFDMGTWQDVIEAFSIKKSMIPHRT